MEGQNMNKRNWKESVIYQIYPRSFADSNQDGIGDINGIRKHLDYLQYLGIDIIWLSPVYQSPNDDNGYDISDYQAIMEDFGTMEDFDNLLREAHEKNICIIMDLVVNHTSDEHRWFQESRKSKDNCFRDYYIWREGKNAYEKDTDEKDAYEKDADKEDEKGNGRNEKHIKEPNNWGACFGGSAWEYDENTDMYYFHSFSKKQPDLNWDNPKVREEIYSMMKWWCDKGIDGFRMDVISMISKDMTFPDGIASEGSTYGDSSPYVCNGPKVHEYLREMNEQVLSRYEIMTVGETPGVTIKEALRYAGENAGELNMIFQFEQTSLVNGDYGKWTVQKPELPDLRKTLNKWQLCLEGKAWNSLYWNNHDQPRVVSRFGNDSRKYRELSAKMLGTCLHMMKGTPYIYQGEELGMTNAGFEDLADYRDIESLNAYHELVGTGQVNHETMMSYLKEISRDNARTPMQWNIEKNAGFCDEKGSFKINPWIKTNPNYMEINAEAEVSNTNSVFHYYKELIRIRKEHEVVVYGSFIPLVEENDSIYAYQRKLGNIIITVACNFTKFKTKCQLFDGIKCSELISNYAIHEEGYLQPYEARVVMVY